jgi:hypothetical protein
MGFSDRDMAYATVIALHLDQLAALQSNRTLQRQVWQNSVAFVHDFSFLSKICSENVRRVITNLLLFDRQNMSELEKAVNKFRAWRNDYESQRLERKQDSGSITVSHAFSCFVALKRRADQTIKIEDVDSAHARWRERKVLYGTESPFQTYVRSLDVHGHKSSPEAHDVTPESEEASSERDENGIVPGGSGPTQSRAGESDESWSTHCLEVSSNADTSSRPQGTESKYITLHLGGWSDSTWRVDVNETRVGMLESEGGWLGVDHVLCAVAYVLCFDP